MIVKATRKRAFMSDAIDVFSITGGPIARVVKRATLETRVVASVRRQMRRAGIRINSQRLRRLVYSTNFASRLAQSRVPDDSLMTDLADVLLAPHRGDMAAASSLRDILINAVRARLAGSSASTEFSDDRNEARTAQIVGVIENHTNDEALFEHRLSSMHPLRAEDFRDLHREWAGAAKWLGAITTTQDRLGLLKRWAAYPPDFPGAPPALFGILADLAADLPPSREAAEAAAKFIEQGSDHGIEPKGYWAIRLLELKGPHDLPAAMDFLAGHRGYPLVEATLHQDGADEAIAALERWSPPTRKEELHRSILLAEYYLRSLKIDDAISIGQATYERFQSTAAAIQAARALTIRHMMHSSIANKKDLPDALLLAVKARADRRRWGVDSGPALALEIRVRRLLSDYDGALDIVNGTGEAPATEVELAHPEVVSETALLQAERGDVEIAKRLLNSAPVAQRPHISAVIADREDRREDAARFWAEAIEATNDLGEQTDHSLQLSLHGIPSPTVFARLKVDNPQIARELEQIAALFGHESGAVEHFRGFANAQYRGALFYYVFLQQEGDESVAASWARESGTKWGDPDLLIESARYFGRNKQYSEAIVDIRAALLTAPNDWGGRRRAYRMLVESHSNAGDWNEALAAASSLAAEDPDNPSAVWALVICQIRLNDLDGAFRSWQQHGSPEPRSEMEVGAWIELLSEFGHKVGTSEDALKISTRFAGSEEIRGALLGVFFFREKPSGEVDDDTLNEGSSEDDTQESDPEVLAFREMLASYLRDFPDGAIRQVPLSMDDPLASIREQFKDSPDVSEVDEQIARGALPIGFAGELHGKSYLESLLSRDLGPVFAGSGNVEAEEAAMVAAHKDGAVIDLSALVTLGRLPDDVRNLLSGHFSTVRALTEHHRDAMVGGRVIARDSGLSYQPARGEIPDWMHRRTPDEIAARASLAAEVEASFSRFASISHPRMTALPLGAGKLDKPFLLGADSSLALALPFWADDTALKEVVRGEGGQPFGTPELLRHARNEGSFDSGLIDLAEATLVASGYSGIRFRNTVWDLASSLASSPVGLMSAVRYAGNDDADERYRTALRLIDSHTDEPDVLGGFVLATAHWLETIAPNEEAASQNIVILAREILGKPWMSSSTLPYCLGAFRAVAGRSDAPTIMLREIYRTFESIADRANDEAAAMAVFELVSRLDPKDGARVRAAVLGRQFA
jgi:tetratricopeptide (TPR) repeat protein